MPYSNREQQREAQRKHYQENKDKFRARVYKRRQENRQFILETQSKTGCVVCGEKHVACLDFHHRNPEEKVVEISIATDDWSLDRLKKEIEKCDVLCSNCHRKEHWIPLDEKYYFDYANRNDIKI